MAADATTILYGGLVGLAHAAVCCLGFAFINWLQRRPFFVTPEDHA